jgi:O-antigen/teichoic acid export membrane protein
VSTVDPPIPRGDIVDTSAAGPAAIRGGVMRTASFAGGLLLALASAPLLIRHLGDAEFGRYASILAVIAIVAGITEGGVNTIALRDLSVATDRAERDRLMSDLLGLRLALSCIGGGLSIGFAAVAGYGADLVLGTALAAIGMLLGLTQTLIAAVLQSRLRFGWAALIELARQVVTVALIVALVLAGAGVLSFLAVAIPAGVVGLVLTVVLVRGTIALRPAFHPRRWLPLMRDTFVFAMAVAVNTLYFRVTLVIMSLVATAEETGYFAVSFRVMEVLIAVPGLLISAAFPIVARSARQDRARFEYATSRLFELGLLLGGLMALGLLLAAPFAIEVLTGSADHPSVTVLQIQSAALIASFVAAATGYPLLSLGRHRAILLANLLSLVLVVALALALTPSLGARGAALAAVAADFALAVANTVLLLRAGGPPLPLSAIAVTAAGFGAGYGAGTLVGVHPLLETAAGAIAFLTVLVVLRRFPPELRELVGRRSPAFAAGDQPPVS